MRRSHAAPEPRTLTLAWRLRGLERPSVVAERLPKILIHRNVPGERVHALMVALDAAWARQAPLGGYGARQRFVACAADLRDQGWPVRHGVSRWRLGELTVDSIRSAGGHSMITTRTELTAAGEPVCTSTSTIVVRGGEDA